MTLSRRSGAEALGAAFLLIHQPVQTSHRPVSPHRIGRCQFAQSKRIGIPVVRRSADYAMAIDAAAVRD
jgi:hypothetical protein